MLRGLHIAASGMLAQQVRHETIANNLANADTAGYKVDGVVFRTALDRAIWRHRDPQRGAPTPQVGQLSFGVTTDEVTTDLRPGPIALTGRSLDVAIEGEGFFVVSTPQGERYTRDGAFRQLADGTLVTADGMPVLGMRGVIRSAAPINIAPNGDVLAEGQVIDRLRIVLLQNPAKEGANRFVGNAQPAQQFSLQVGALERSNVSVVQAMVEMIVAMRAYEASHRAVLAHDETLQRAVNEVGKVS
ncbi:MAG: flagellar hook-basal body protein [Armatimonadota bacterium]|nr:flagellar hook-basal body protein [Armatimonadota bacterium]MDW8289315.1 flagellar hook-basal body protein [Armatimonadota bacterium]